MYVYRLFMVVITSSQRKYDAFVIFFYFEKKLQIVGSNEASCLALITIFSTDK